MMRKILLLLLPLYLFALKNPYETLSAHEKLNVMVNYFLNESLYELRPKLPQKKALQDDGAILDPVKYELYFSYIQRLKAIKEGRAEEQKLIDEEYAGKIGFYNGKLKSLDAFYKQQENLYPILQTSINKAFKVVFGKPILTNINYTKELNLLEADLSVIDLYRVEKFSNKRLELFIYEGDRKSFMRDPNSVDLRIEFEYDGNYLSYKKLHFTLNDHEYIGTFQDLNNEKIKLDIKINDAIFQPVQLGEIK